MGVRRRESDSSDTFQDKEVGQGLEVRRPLTEDKLRLLQQFRKLHDDVLAGVASTLAGLGLRPVTRLKTVETIVAKLQRGTTHLSEMQDIAGVRVVEDWNIATQDEVA